MSEPRCDFCAGGPTLAPPRWIARLRPITADDAFDLHTLLIADGAPVESLVIATSMLQTDFAMCEACAELVIAGDVDALKERVRETWIASRGDALEERVLSWVLAVHGVAVTMVDRVEVLS